MKWSKYVIAIHSPSSVLGLGSFLRTKDERKGEKDFNMKNCHIRSLFLNFLQK